MDSQILARSSKRIIVSTFLLGAFAGWGVAPERPSEPPIGARGPLAESILRQRLVLWQERLKLQDWTISIVVSHPSDLRRGTLGNIHWDPDRKTAVIRVLDASDYQMPFNGALKDMEFTVIHELIHLELSPLTRNFKSRSEESFTEEEQAVNRIADALTMLDDDEQPARLRAPAVSPSPRPAGAR